MKKRIDINRVKKALRLLGLRKTKGNGSGHEIWITDDGKQCRPSFRQKEIMINQLYSLGMEMENRGIATRDHFMEILEKV